MNPRIGHGYDAHRFSEDSDPGRPLKLGGVEVPSDRSLKAHSDGDVLIHALCDALLGAAGRGDIGRHFPDDDPSLAGVDSAVLLRRVIEVLGKDGWHPGNADITVIAQAPRLGPHIQRMRGRLAGLMDCAESCVNVKATTTEGMGFIGRREGIAVHAVVLIER